MVRTWGWSRSHLAGRERGRPEDSGLPSAQAQPAMEQPQVNGAPAEAAKPEVTLAECLAVGMSRQPALAAARASLANAVIANNSVQTAGRLATLFARDLPVRKEQGN